MFFFLAGNRVKIRVNFAAHTVNFRNVTRSLKYPSHGPVPLIQISSLKYSSCTRSLTSVCSGSERRRRRRRRWKQSDLARRIPGVFDGGRPRRALLATHRVPEQLTDGN